MWKIYCQASHVLAYLGPHEDNSECIARFAEQIHSAWDQWRSGLDSPWNSDDEDLDLDLDLDRKPRTFMTWEQRMASSRWADPLIEGLSDAEYRTLSKSYGKFAQRGYWHRLWIVQEIAAGYRPNSKSDRLRFLCGDDNIHRGIFDSLDALTQRQTRLAWSPDRLQSRENIDHMHFLSMLIADGNKVDIGRALNDFKDYGCQDPRDRIYGVLGLIDWKHHGKSPIVPDYGISNFQLARKLCHYVEMEYISAMLIAMEVKCTHPGMQNLIRWRVIKTKWKELHDGRSVQTIRPRKVLKSPFVKSLWLEDSTLLPMKQEWCDQLGLDRLWKHDLFPAIAWNLSDENVYALPKCVVEDGLIAFLVCAAAEAGDMLVHLIPTTEEIDDGGAENLFLVLRHEHDDQHSVVGQAIPNVSAGDGERLVEEQHHANRIPRPEWTAVGSLKLQLTKDDALVFLGQDFRLDRNRGLRSATAGLVQEQWTLAILTRLFVHPVSHPYCAATYTVNSSA